MFGRAPNHETLGGDMQAATLTTTLSELNRLFALYYEVIDKKPSHSQQAQKAWIDYVTYVRRYNEERGLNFSSKTCRGM